MRVEAVFFDLFDTLLLLARAQKAVFIGDMLDLDIIGPKRVGIKTILIERRPMQDHAEAKPDKVVKSLTELLGILDDC